MSVTDNDLKVFSTLGHQQKAAALYYYLCEGYNMQDVGEDVLGCAYGTQASQLPSVIMRCYGFSGKNSGSFARMGLGKPAITIEDFVDFVRKYPNGLNNKQILIDYMKELKNRRLTQNHTQSYSQTSYTTSSSSPDWGYRGNQSSYREPSRSTEREYVSSSYNSESALDYGATFYIMMFFFAVALLWRWKEFYCLWGFWFWNIRTIIVALLACSGLGWILVLSQNAYSRSRIIAIVVLAIIGTLCAVNTVCNIDGSLFSRVGTAVVTFPLAIIVDGLGK